MDSPTPPPLELSVILCVRNGAGSISDQLEALAAQEWDAPWEVLVVDHESTDATAQVVGAFIERDPRFRMIAARAKRGLSFARNVGVANSTARAVAFCDHDDLVGERWVAAMGNALRDHAVVACRFDWNRVGNSGPALRGGIFQHDRVEEIFGLPAVSGVSGWQRWLWEALGGNDETLTFTGEDFDMSIRAYLEYGVTPHFAADAVYHVARRAGLRPTFRQARAYGRSSVVIYDLYGSGRVDLRRARKQALKSWAWLVLHVFDLRDADAGPRWARQAGKRYGRLEQSIRSRTLWL
jgi:glycosyltransferase involved in cell wall biosynthesis